MTKFIASIYWRHTQVGDLSNAANLIVLIGAVIVAIKTIYGFFKKPVEIVQENARQNEEEHIKEVLKEEMPDLLSKNCEPILASLNEIKEMTLTQEERLEQMQKSLDLLNVSQLDMLRYNMNRLYYKYRPYKKILDADKQAFLKLYHDYKDMHGNTWIDSLYNEVIEWPIVASQDELKN